MRNANMSIDCEKALETAEMMISARDKIISSVSNDLSVRDEEINALADIVSSLKEEIKALNVIVSSHVKEIEALNVIVSSREADITTLLDMLDEAAVGNEESMTEDSTELYDPNEVARQHELEILWDQLLELRAERDKHAECRKKPVERAHSTIWRTEEERIKMEDHLKKNPPPEIDWSHYERAFTKEEQETDDFYASEIEEIETKYYKLKNSPRGSTLSNTGQSVMTPKRREQNRESQRAYQERKKQERLLTGEGTTEEEKAKNREKQRRFRERQKQKQA